MAEPVTRHLPVVMDLAIGLDDYVATRLVELCVHADELAVSITRRERDSIDALRVL